MVEAARDLDGFSFLVFDHLEDVLLCFLDVFRWSGELDLRPGSALHCLPGDIDADVELGFEGFTGFAAVADEDTVLLGSYLDMFGYLIFALVNKSFDGGHNFFDNCLVALNSDNRVIGFLLREADGSGKFPAVVRSSGLDADIADVCACEEVSMVISSSKTRLALTSSADESSMVLSVDIN